MGVHICSAPQDHATIVQFAEDICGLGYPLVDRIRTSDVTVLAVSDDALNSRDCFDQVQHARTHGSHVVYVLVRPLASGTPWPWTPPDDVIDYTRRTPDALIALSSALAGAAAHSRRRRPKVPLWIAAAVILVVGGGATAFLLLDRDSPAAEMAQTFVDSVNADDVTTLATVVCADDQEFLPRMGEYLAPDTGDRVELRGVNNGSFTVTTTRGVERIPIVNQNGRFVACGYHTGLDAQGFVVEGWSN